MISDASSRARGINESAARTSLTRPSSSAVGASRRGLATALANHHLLTIRFPPSRLDRSLGPASAADPTVSPPAADNTSRDASCPCRSQSGSRVRAWARTCSSPEGRHAQIQGANRLSMKAWPPRTLSTIASALTGRFSVRVGQIGQAASPVPDAGVPAARKRVTAHPVLAVSQNRDDRQAHPAVALVAEQAQTGPCASQLSWTEAVHKGDGPEIVCDRAPRAPVSVEANQSRGSRGGPQERS